MNLDHFLAALSVPSERNSALQVLESLMADLTDERRLGLLSGIISEPASIEDTHSFALFIADLGAECFIAPLIESISRATPGSVWLADYMYALGILLIDRDGFHRAEEGFVHLVGNWLLSTGGGEISWKAGDIMAELEHPGTRDYLLRGATDENLFHQTRIACLRGIMSHYPGEAATVIDRLAYDSDEQVREAAADARTWLNRRTAET